MDFSNGFLVCFYAFIILNIMIKCTMHEKHLKIVIYEMGLSAQKYGH